MNSLIGFDAVQGLLSSSDVTQSSQAELAQCYCDRFYTDTAARQEGFILPGADTFWGLFETSQSGFNEFKVRLTGPDSSELIGSWAIPALVDGEPHQLMGAWIAARES